MSPKDRMWVSASLMLIIGGMGFLPAEEQLGDSVSTASWVLYGIVLGSLLVVFIRATHHAIQERHNRRHYWNRRVG